MIRFFTSVVFILTLAIVQRAQIPAASEAKKNAPTTVSAVKSSPAYAELLLRRAEREAELEELLPDYTEEYPKVKELRFELDLLKKASDKIAAVNAADAGKLTLALGKLLVRKIELETDWWNLRQQYTADAPQVKRARRKIEIYERAIKEIL